MTDVSVLIPTRRRPLLLDGCLTALSGQRLAPGRAFEVVVVADGDPDGVAPVVARHAAAGLAVRLVTQAHAGPAAARNRAAREATARWLVFTDDDCAARPGWLAALTAALEHDPACVVGCRIHNGHPDQVAAEAAHVVLDVLLDHVVRTGDPAAFFPTSSLGLARAVFDELGGFDERFPRPGGEDRDLCLRAGAAGHALVAVDAAGVDHFHEMGTRELWRQQRTYGRGAAVLRAAQTTTRGGAARVRAGFYAELARAPFVRRPLRRALPLAAHVLLAQAAYLAGMVQEAALGSARSRLRTR